MKKRILLAACVAAMLALGIGGGVAMGASQSIPDSGGVIHGCYKPSGYATGALIVIDTDEGQSCPSDMTALDWDEEGPAGVSGYEVDSCSPQGTDCSTFNSDSATLDCPSGKVAVSGGYSGTPITSEGPLVTGIFPTSTDAGFEVTWGSSASDAPAQLYVTCANAS